MKIIYPQTNGEIAIIMPCDCGLTTEQIAAKDVPFGVPFLICEDIDLPEDWSTSAAWECDFSSPSGIGMGAQRWFIAQAEAALAALAAVEITEETNVDQHNAEVWRHNALIAQMKAEVLQLEGVTL